MALLLSGKEIRQQSLNVWAQFGEKLWIPNAKKNATLKSSDVRTLEHSGIGKFMVFCGMGSSLEDQIDFIKKYRDKIDVACCDKAFGPLLDHGVKSDYVMLADAGIPFRYFKDYTEESKGVNLISTPYGNPEWTHAWKGDIYFYVNQDSIESELTFAPIMGNEMRTIPASSNVSNAMIVFWNDCNERINANWGGYEHYFLVGYDYSWPVKGNYYAWNNIKPKRFYNNHRTLIDYKGNYVFTSENLLFSAKWLVSYITSFNLPVINCCDKGLLDIPVKSTLGAELSLIHSDKVRRKFVKDSYDVWKSASKNLKLCESKFNESREALLWQ